MEKESKKKLAEIEFIYKNRNSADENKLIITGKDRENIVLGPTTTHYIAKWIARLEL